MKANRITWAISLLAITNAVAFVASSYTFAAFFQKADVDQSVGVSNRLGINICLDLGEWSSDGAVVKMYVFNDNDNSTPRKFISPSGTTAEGYQVFNYPISYNRLIFVRCNPAASVTYFVDNTGADHFSDAFVSGVAWNRTDYFIYNTSFTASNRLCTITSSWSENNFIAKDGSTVLGTISVASWSNY